MLQFFIGNRCFPMKLCCVHWLDDVDLAILGEGDERVLKILA